MTAFCIVDVETSGTDDDASLLEIGAALFDAKLGCLLKLRTWLVCAMSNDAETVNRIPASIVNGIHAITADVARAELAAFGAVAEFWLAHNATFDRRWLPGIGERWIDTCDEAEWPRPSSSKSLVALALAHDVGVARAHRACEDVLTLAALLTRVHEIEGGLEAWLTRALEPRIEIAAELPMDGNDAAKDAGFRWDRDAQFWRRSVRTSKRDELVASLPFATFDPSEPVVTLIGEQPRSQNDLAKAAKFRWNPDLMIWWRTVRASQVEAVQQQLGFMTRVSS